MKGRRRRGRANDPGPGRRDHNFHFLALSLDLSLASPWFRFKLEAFGVWVQLVCDCGEKDVAVNK